MFRTRCPYFAIHTHSYTHPIVSPSKYSSAFMYVHRECQCHHARPRHTVSSAHEYNPPYNSFVFRGIEPVRPLSCCMRQGASMLSRCLLFVCLSIYLLW